MLDTSEVRRSFKIMDDRVEFIKACLISENWVGIDCFCKLDISKDVPNPTKNKKQTQLDSYVGMNKVKKPRTYKKKSDPKILFKEANNPNVKAPNEKTGANVNKLFNTNDKEKNDKETQSTMINQNGDSSYGCPESSNNSTGSKINANDTSSFRFSSEFKKRPLSDVLEKGNCILPLMSRQVKSDTVNTQVGEQDEVWNCNKGNLSTNAETSIDPTTNAIKTHIMSPISRNNDLSKMKPAVENNNSEQFSEDDRLNSTFIRKMSKKYMFSSNQQKASDDVKNNEKPSEDNLKKSMDNPDSTVDQADLCKNFFSPPSKKQRRTNNGPTAFDFFPQKSIKWRSPLVHSPAIKYSPMRQPVFDFGDEGADHFKESADVLGFSDSSFSSKNSVATDNAGKQAVNFMGSTNLVKKKSKHQFPLSDQEYTEDANESFSTKLKGLEDICDPEYFGLSKRGKDSAVTYYSQLMNTSAKSDETSAKTHRNNIPKTNEASRAFESKSETLLQSQDLFSQSDFLALSKELDISQVSTHIDSKTADMPCRESNIATPSFVPSFAPQYLNNSSNVISNHNSENNNDFLETVPSTSKECRDTRIFRPISLSGRTERYIPEHRSFDPYILNESRYFAHPSHYFDYQRPISENVYRHSLPTTYPCMCCGHQPVRYLNGNHGHDPRFENVITSPPYYKYMDERSAYPIGGINCPRVNDIPENYIDNCLQQLDEEPLGFIPRTDIGTHSNPLRTEGIRANLQTFKHDSSVMNRSNLSLETDQLMYANQKENMNPQLLHGSNFQIRQANSFLPVSENKRDYLQSLRRDSQVSQPKNNRRIIREIFTPHPKPQLIHNSPMYTSVSTLPQANNMPIPRSSQRKQLNFNSFEERLDDIIMPPGQCLPSGFAGQVMNRCSNYNIDPYNPNQQFIMNRFMQPNNLRDTQ